MLLSRISKLFLGAALSVALLAGGSVGASAATQAHGSAAAPVVRSQGEAPTPEQLQEGFRQLLDSPLPRVSEVVGNEKKSTFTLEGFDFTVVEQLPDTASIRLGGGWDGNGLYIDFNKFDQDALAAGSAWAFGAAICAIPAVGTVACVAVGAILAAATLYLSYNGPCPSNQVLRIYTVPGNRCV